MVQPCKPPLALADSSLLLPREGSEDCVACKEGVANADVLIYIETRDEKAAYRYPKYMKYLIKNFLGKARSIEVKDMGALNQRRPVMFMGGKFLISPGLGKDIGATVTDITLTLDNEPMHLSLKMGYILS